MLNDLLHRHREAVLGRWRALVLATYPPDVRRYVEKEAQPFANPVGSAISSGLETLYDQLAGEGEVVLPEFFLDLLKVRAVQDFTASEAIGFLPALKGIVRAELGEEIRKDGRYEDLLAFESRVDLFTLAAFDAYMKAKERLYEVRANEVRHLTSLLLSRAGLTWEPPEKG